MTLQVISAASAPMLIERALCWACFSGSVRLGSALVSAFGPFPAVSVCKMGVPVETFVIKERASLTITLELAGVAIGVRFGA